MITAGWLRAVATAGMLGPALFGLALVSLTLLQYDFMRSLGWHPLRAPTLDWPSGLALGPYGWAMTAAFLLLGLCLAAFGLGLRQALHATVAGRLGGSLLAAAGLACLALAFQTDPTLRQTPATWHGRLHDAAYVLAGIALCAGLVALGAAFRQDERWSSLFPYTWLAAALVLPAYFLKGIAVYGYLGVLLAWSEAVAFRLWVLAEPFL